MSQDNGTTGQGSDATTLPDATQSKSAPSQPSLTSGSTAGAESFPGKALATSEGQTESAGQDVKAKVNENGATAGQNVATEGSAVNGTTKPTEAAVAPSPTVPESTLGFAQAMLAVPVPQITLPTSLPHGHGHGHAHGPSHTPVTSSAQATVTAAPATTQVGAVPGVSTVEEPAVVAAAPQVPAPPMVVSYHPVTRAVDTYGGLDIMLVEKLSVPHYVPGREHLGAVDIHALTMSLKSGMKLEVTNALNTLSSLTKLESDNLVLSSCPELLDILLDLAEDTFRGWKTGIDRKDAGEDLTPSLTAVSRKEAEEMKRSAEEEDEEERKEEDLPLFFKKDQFDTYQELFEASVDEACHLMELKSSSREVDGTNAATNDQEDVEMTLAGGRGSCKSLALNFHEWCSNKDQFLSLSNTLRNLAFLPANFQFLAHHGRFLEVLKGTVLSFQMRGLRRQLNPDAEQEEDDDEKADASKERIGGEEIVGATTASGTDTAATLDGVHKDASIKSEKTDATVVDDKDEDISITEGSGNSALSGSDSLSMSGKRQIKKEGSISSTSKSRTRTRDEWLPETGALTILEHRKDVLTILSNLAGYMTLPDGDTAQWIMMMLLDFLQVHDTYYASLALEVTAKLGISHENRVLLASVDRELRMAHLRQKKGSGSAASRANGSAGNQYQANSHGNKHSLYTSDEKNSGKTWEQGGFLQPLFQLLSTMVAQALTTVTSQPPGSTLPNSALAHLEMLMLALFNLAVLSEAGFRRHMALQPGFVSGLLRLGVLLADIRTPSYTSASMRTVETVRVIAKDNEGLL
ncbi:hypothetical protein BGZ94_005064, partial [Podila epigama]